MPRDGLVGRLAWSISDPATSAQRRSIDERYPSRVSLRYWSRALISLGRHAVEREFLREWLSSGLIADARPKATEVYLYDWLPESERVQVDMGTIRYQLSNQDPLERFVLGAWCRAKKPKRIFEIGTYDGTTTLLLARNAPDAEVLTLDLPLELATAASVTPEAECVALGGVGVGYKRQPEEARITQLYGDSRTFDFSPWRGSVDLVVVDGGHIYDCVSSDTRNALVMVRRGGAVVWDDYTWVWPDVIRAVDETGLPVVRIGGTGLAVYTP